MTHLVMHPRVNHVTPLCGQSPTQLLHPTTVQTGLGLPGNGCNVLLLLLLLQLLLLCLSVGGSWGGGSLPSGGFAMLCMLCCACLVLN